MERNASIGILLNNNLDLKSGEFKIPQKLLEKKYNHVKSQYQGSGIFLGSICNEILPASDKFVIVDGGASETKIHENFSNIPQERLKIYAFEPFSKFAQIERDRFKKSSLDIEIIEIGLWQNKDTRKISSLGSPSLFPRDGGFIQSEEDPCIELDSLNNILREKECSSIDFLKLNMEGSELFALKGATDYLNNIQMIRTEVKFFHENRNHPLYFEICGFLNDFNFTLYEIAKPVFGFTQDYVNELHHLPFTYLKDSWITPPPAEAHWLFFKDKSAVSPAKLLKRVIGLEAFGKIPQAVEIMKFLTDRKIIPENLPNIGNLPDHIQKVEETYRAIIGIRMEN